MGSSSPPPPTATQTTTATRDAPFTIPIQAPTAPASIPRVEASLPWNGLPKASASGAGVRVVSLVMPSATVPTRPAGVHPRPTGPPPTQAVTSRVLCRSTTSSSTPHSAENGLAQSSTVVSRHARTLCPATLVLLPMPTGASTTFGFTSKVARPRAATTSPNSLPLRLLSSLLRQLPPPSPPWFPHPPPLNHRRLHQAPTQHLPRLSLSIRVTSGLEVRASPQVLRQMPKPSPLRLPNLLSRANSALEVRGSPRIRRPMPKPLHLPRHNLLKRVTLALEAKAFPKARRAGRGQST